MAYSGDASRGLGNNPNVDVAKMNNKVGHHEISVSLPSGKGKKGLRERRARGIYK